MSGGRQHQPARPCTATDLDGLRTPLIEAARYNRLENVPAIQALPNAHALDTQMTAKLLGCDVQTLRQIRAELQAALGQACDELLSDHHFTQAARELPFAAGDVIVAAGDSITADALSWAEILATALARLRPGELQFINASVSGDTTADLIAHFGAIAAHRPDWILAMIGTNDARRHGPDHAARMASPGETERNLRAFAALVSQHTSARLALITPAPVDEARILRYERFRSDATTWQETEIAQIAEIVRRQGPLVIDINRTLSAQDPGTYLTADGIHPSLAGQRQIARQIATALAAPAARHAVTSKMRSRAPATENSTRGLAAETRTKTGHHVGTTPRNTKEPAT